MGGGDSNHTEEPLDSKLTPIQWKDPLETVLSSIHNLYTVRDTFFPLDPSIKKARLDNLMRDVLLVLAEISSGALIVSCVFSSLRSHWKCWLL